MAQVKEQIPVFLIKGFFGSEILGYYSISMRYLRLPINLLAQSIGRVYFQTISKMKREGESNYQIGNYSLKNINRAMKVAMIPMIVIIAVGDIVCEIMFGAGYDVAGNIMRLIAFNGFFLFLGTATNGLAIIIEKQKYILGGAITQLLGYVLGISIGYYIWDSIYVSCLFMTLTYVTAQIVYFALMFKFTQVKWKTYVRNAVASIFLVLIVSIGIRGTLLLLNIVTTL